MRAWFVLLLITLVAALGGVLWGVLEARVVSQRSRIPLEELIHGGSRPGEAQPDAGAVPKVQVDQESYDFGSMDSQKEEEHEFAIKNVGTAPLRLREGGTTCRCAISELKSELVYPGQSTKVKLKWTAKEFFGPFEQTAKIETNDPTRPLLTLKVKGRITTPLRALPDHLIFSRLGVGQSVRGEVRLFAYTPDASRALKTGELELVEKEAAPLFEVSLSPLPADQIEAEKDAKGGARVEVIVKSGLPPGPFEQTIRLKTGLAAVPVIDIPIKGRVGSDISVLGSGWNESRAWLDLGVVPGGEGAQRRLMLVVRGPLRRHVAFEVAQTVPPGLLEAELGETTEINQGVAMQTPLWVRVRKGSGPANYLGSKEGQIGHILLRTTHPHVPELRIAVRFAVEGGSSRPETTTE